MEIIFRQWVPPYLPPEPEVQQQSWASRVTSDHLHGHENCLQRESKNSCQRLKKMIKSTTAVTTFLSIIQNDF